MQHKWLVVFGKPTGTHLSLVPPVMRMPGTGVAFIEAPSIWLHAGHWLGSGHTLSWQLTIRDESAASEHLYSTLATFPVGH